MKDPKNLFNKIIRKKKALPNRNITLSNYELEINDLAGVRVLHLFKGGWERIHKYITQTWTLKEQPIAYYRTGDSPTMLDRFSKQGCDLRVHPAAYRSVHYVIETSTTKEKKYVEIQVRTIFEEGWSEVDHRIRYPNNTDNQLVNDMLMMLNRLAGNADEMSSFIQELNLYIKESQWEFKALELEKDQQIAELKEIIKNANLSPGDKNKFENVADRMSAADNAAAFAKGIFLTNPFPKLPSLAGLKARGLMTDPETPPKSEAKTVEPASEQ
ncbi:RelA/SpoT domain-containing protein [Hymenobacter siberiensis]|uniref:RelA/SpoT domain-containing protein n=1 Tax=Hymenobacter siberiensis TaxID=2848396 RepID=UPI001C1DE11C|nr:RelA/SpoT domain-containing protein [Hymenobacter siberiensis]MBU6122052.1 RelA/SpoT domain-containing protein [Hymenobacter siberiensis]